MPRASSRSPITTRPTPNPASGTPERDPSVGRVEDALLLQRPQQHDRARHRDAAHREQIAQREVEAHSEHEEDDADLGELPRE